MNRKGTPEERARAFLHSRKTLSLATVNTLRVPLASYAPFVHKDGDLFVYTSRMSQHTGNMNENHRASAMVVSEQSAAEKNLSAAVRITFSCTVEVVERDNPKREEILDLFQKSLGDSFTKVRELGDFTLFCLRPLEVVYVEGFGEAYRMDKHFTKSARVMGTQTGARLHTAETNK